MLRPYRKLLWNSRRCCCSNELPGEAVLSKVAFQNFLCEKAKVATGMQEKLLDAKLV